MSKRDNGDPVESAQRRLIEALRRAVKSAPTLDSKIAAQAKVCEAEEELRRLRLTYFDRQDAAGGGQ